MKDETSIPSSSFLIHRCLSAPPVNSGVWTLNQPMKPILLLILLFLFPPGSEAATNRVAPDVFWFDTYGNIRWEDEKARLDNFVIHLFNQPNTLATFTFTPVAIPW